MHGFGPIVAEPEATEPVFHGDWERAVFSTSRGLLQRRLWSLDRFRSFVEQQSPVEYLQHSYYENWLSAIERLSVAHHVVSSDELTARRVLSDGPPPEAEWQLSHEPDAGPRFAAGDTVRVRNRHPSGHTRAPRYVRDHVGTVLGCDGAEPLPELAAQNVCSPEHVYSVRFHSSELWGTPTSPGHTVVLNLWESYLMPVSP
jgi:nitrile hydratase